MDLGWPSLGAHPPSPSSPHPPLLPHPPFFLSSPSVFPLLFNERTTVGGWSPLCLSAASVLVCRWDDNKCTREAWGCESESLHYAYTYFTWLVTHNVHMCETPLRNFQIFSRFKRTGALLEIFTLTNLGFSQPGHRWEYPMLCPPGSNSFWWD
jgi:hypothetical protein